MSPTLAESLDASIAEVRSLAAAEAKLSGFCIGNTRKISATGMYLSPIRKTSRLVAGSVIVYSVDQAVAVARAVDGHVDYVLVDTEKKISPELYGAENVGNVERAVRESVRHSRILTYKGNDITVDSIENLIVQVLSTHPRGLSGKRAAIIGAGNVGAKLALKLVERGMDVNMFRRDAKKLEAISSAINIIKPAETIACVSAANDPISAAKGVDLLVGLTQGTPVISTPMIRALATGAVLIDGGKGCLDRDAIALATYLGIPIYRADVRSGFEGHLSMALETERHQNVLNVGRSVFNGVKVVSGGLLALADEVVVDSITQPTAVYGVANGSGDFCRILTEEQSKRLHAVRQYIMEMT